MARRYYSSTARRTTLASDINSSVTSLTVAAVSGWPSSFPYTLCIDEGTLSEELVEVTARSGTTVTVTRGVDGSSAVAHTAGATVNHAVSARDFNEPNQFLNEGGTISASGSSAALTIANTGSGDSLRVEDSSSPDSTPFVVSASGDVGVGTGSPAQKLDVVGTVASTGLAVTGTGLVSANSSGNAFEIRQTGSGNALVVEDSANPDATPFVVDASGNVGIGTSGPAVRLNLRGADAEQTGVLLESYASNTRQLYRRYNGTVASPAAVSTSDQIGSFVFQGYDGTAPRSAVQITAFIDGTPGASDMPGGITIATTADGASSPTERMRIASTGNVGIGTSSPASKLHVYDASTSTFEVGGDGNVTLNLRRASTNNSSVSTDIYKSRGTVSSPTVVADGDIIGQWQFKAYDGSAYRDAALMRVTVDGAPGASDMPGRFGFWTAADGGTTLTERMRIDNAGLITGTGTSLGAWTAYTPTLGGTGWALGNGIIAGAYCQVGKTVKFRMRVVFGSTSTFGASAAPTVTLPLAAKDTTSLLEQAASIGVLMEDVSAGNRYVGFAWRSTTTEIEIARKFNTDDQVAPIMNSVPFTWATTDTIYVAGTYEAA